VLSFTVLLFFTLRLSVAYIVYDFVIIIGVIRSQIRSLREDTHLPAGRRRKLGHDERVSIRFFLAGLGRKISAISGDDRETSYLFQRISVLIQRFNATLLRESFADENRSDD